MEVPRAMMLIPLLLLAASAGAAPANDRAQEVVDKMREALGGKGRLDAVKSVSVEGEMRRVIPVDGGEARDMSGEFSVDALLPDRYLKIETLSPMPGMPGVGIGTGLDGQEAWRAPINTPSGHGMVVRVATPEGPGGAESLRRRTRGELIRFALLALATPLEDISFSYAGEAEAPEGRAHVLDVAGPEGFAARVFVDTKTHRPLMASFKTQLPRMQIARMEGPADAARAQAQNLARAAAAAPEAEAKLFVSNFQKTDGLLLPHTLSQQVEGGASEEWTIKKWKLNPALKPEHFRKK
jgi:hypothetical protein